MAAEAAAPGKVEVGSEVEAMEDLGWVEKEDEAWEGEAMVGVGSVAMEGADSVVMEEEGSAVVGAAAD